MDAVTAEVTDGKITFKNNLPCPIGVTWIVSRNGNKPSYKEATLDGGDTETFCPKQGESMKVICQHGYAPVGSTEATIAATEQVA
jgi:hypothetical protein